MTDADSELESIINGCLNNNRLSQRQLYDRYASTMFVVCRRYANSDEEAEDMLMEGFMRVFRSLETFRGESSFGTWIHAVMVKTAVSHYRSVRRFRNEPLDVGMEDLEAVAGEESVTTRLDVRIVIDTLQRMPETLRVVFNLRAVEGYSFAEVGEMLGKKEGSVRVTYLRAKRWIRKELGIETAK